MHACMYMYWVLTIWNAIPLLAYDIVNLSLEIMNVLTRLVHRELLY